MVKLALALTFIVAAMGCLVNKLVEVFDFPALVYIAPALYLPAGVLGIRSWLRHRTFARRWPVVACVLLVWAGMLYWGIGILKHDLFLAGWMTIALPIAALIVEKRCWWFCAKTHVFASVVAVALMAWLAFRANGYALGQPFRLGLILSDDGTQLMTGLNEVAAQLAFSSILAFVLYLRGARARDSKARAGHGFRIPKGFSLVWGLVLSLACILTASRSAFLAWFAAAGLLLVWGTRSLAESRLRDLAALATLAAFTALFLGVSTGRVVGETLYQRMAGSQSETLLTLGGRIPIWENAVAAWLSDPMTAVTGAGVARADEIVARGDPFAWTDNYGIRHRSCHNTLLHWMLSFGIVGMIPAVCMTAGAWREGRRLDRRDGSINRTAILVCVGLLASMGVLYFRSFWLAAASLMLAMVSDDPALVRSSHGPLAALRGGRRRRAARIRKTPAGSSGMAPKASADTRRRFPMGPLADQGVAVARAERGNR